MKEDKNTPAGNTNSKVFKSAQLTIQHNGIAFEDTVIQISNITQIWAGDIPKKSLPLVAIIIGALVGLLLFFQGVNSRNGGAFVLIGLIFLGGVGYYVWMHMQQIQYYAVNIELNSGRLYSFTSDKRSFIDESFEVLKNIICDELKGDKFIINFDNGTVINETHNCSVL